MDIIETKYKNFQQFCQTMKPDNEFVKILQTTPLPLFLQTIKSKTDQNLNSDDVCNLVLEKAQIQQSDVQKDIMEKFKRYIEYFLEIVQTIE